MRKTLLAKNTIASLVFQITTIVCGFILPRIILQQFGSETNGLISSITQFLGIIGFLELGVGAVVQSSLYKPLADDDNNQISAIIVSAQSFFNRIAQILLIYIVILCAIYPHIAAKNMGWLYTATLIVSMSVSYFAQYYFGIVDRILLNADQKGYIQYNSQTITLIINTFACAVLIKLGASIHIVKLTTSLLFVLRPVLIRRYVDKNYKIDRKIQFIGEPIKHKWNGVAQHVSAVVLDSTDSIVLTIFGTLVDVSIYSVYHLVVYGIKQVLISMTMGFQALFGELWAKKELEELKVTFEWAEWIIHTGTVFLFGCTGVLILPFIDLYTRGVTDANYLQPAFATLIIMAQAGHCLRLPYNTMILASGRYKETQECYVIAAVSNVVISVLTVKVWGLIGVAIGTLVAMSYQTVWMALYNSKEMLKCSIFTFVKQVFVDLLTVIIAGGISMFMFEYVNSYLMWSILAIRIAVIWILVIFIINYILYKEKIIKLLSIIMNKFATH